MKYLLIAVLALSFAGCGGNAEDVSPQVENNAVIEKTAAASMKAPGFTLADLNGETVELDDFSGKPVLVVFWATWCPHCKAEIPKLKEIHAENSDADFKILALSVDDNPEKLKKFAAENGIEYTILSDSDTSIATSYGVVGIPAHFVIDSEGNKYFFGPNIDKAYAKIETILKTM